MGAVLLVGAPAAMAQPANPTDAAPADEAVDAPATEDRAADERLAVLEADARARAEQTSQLQAELEQQQARIAEQETRLQRLQTSLEEAQTTAEAAVEQAGVAAEDADAAANRFRMYGFTDVGFKKAWLSERATWAHIMPEAATFVLGNVNLYFDARPLPGFRALTEIRFTNYPHGEEIGTNFERTSTRTMDVNSPSGRNYILWGSTVIERAWLEWNELDAFRIRAGYFLTPYGIWNLDHGTPTLISLALPDFFAAEYFPTHQTGLQLLGTIPTGSWELGYHATVSNGRTAGQLDETDDKAVGGRVFAQFEGSSRFTLGASGYHGRYSESSKTLTSVNPLQVDAQETVAYREYALASDFALDTGPFRLRTELVMQRRQYDPGQRDAYGPGAYKPDFYRYDYYVLAAYQLPWAGLEPYGDFEHRIDGLDDMLMVSAGLNLRFNAAAQLKSQWGHVRFLDRTTPDDFHFVDTRFVLAF